MRFTEIMAIIFLIIIFTGSSSELLSVDSKINYEALLNSDSYVPEKEAYIHIAGGFYSVFEGKGGMIFETENKSSNSFPGKEDTIQDKNSDYGYIKMKLERLEYTSRFIYRPKGDLIIQTPGQEAKCFSMEKLDYISVPGYSEPCYRLSGSLSDCNESQKIIEAHLICYAEGGTNPVLYGNIYLTDYTGLIVCYPIKIGGRRENAADNHLHKVIARVSHFTI